MKNVLIIGASSGIGNAIARKLSNDANIYGSYFTNASQSVEQIKYFFFDVMNDQLDLSILPEQLDGLVYCPGSILLKPFTRITEQDLLNDYKLNVIGALKCIQSVYPLLKRSSFASIILFSTVAVQSGMPFHALVASSKGAIEGLTHALAAELSPSIRVNCIAPSLTNTSLAASLLNTEDKRIAAANRHPMKKIGDANDIAEMAIFLLSEKSKWITGQILHVDGGMSTIQ